MCFWRVLRSSATAPQRSVSVSPLVSTNVLSIGSQCNLSKREESASDDQGEGASMLVKRAQLARKTAFRVQNPQDTGVRPARLPAFLLALELVELTPLWMSGTCFWRQQAQDSAWSDQSKGPVQPHTCKRMDRHAFVSRRPPPSPSLPHTPPPPLLPVCVRLSARVCACLW